MFFAVCMHAGMFVLLCQVFDIAAHLDKYPTSFFQLSPQTANSLFHVYFNHHRETVVWLLKPSFVNKSLCYSGVYCILLTEDNLCTVVHRCLILSGG